LGIAYGSGINIITGRVAMMGRGGNVPSVACVGVVGAEPDGVIGGNNMNAGSGDASISGVDGNGDAAGGGELDTGDVAREVGA
jgi:hypothetical protein